MASIDKKFKNLKDWFLISTVYILVISTILIGIPLNAKASTEIVVPIERAWFEAKCEYGRLGSTYDGPSQWDYFAGTPIPSYWGSSSPYGQPIVGTKPWANQGAAIVSTGYAYSIKGYSGSASPSWRAFNGNHAADPASLVLIEKIVGEGVTRSSNPKFVYTLDSGAVTGNFSSLTTLPWATSPTSGMMPSINNFYYDDNWQDFFSSGCVEGKTYTVYKTNWAQFIGTTGGSSAPPAPVKPPYTPPTTPVITPPNFSDWEWTQNGNDSIEGIGKDFTPNTGTQTAPIFDLGNSDKLSVDFTNIPTNGILNLSGKEFVPELSLKNENDVFKLPIAKANNSVTQTEVNTIWGKYTLPAKPNETDLFIYKVKDPSSIPTKPETMFDNTSLTFQYKQKIVNSTSPIENFKITEPGYYVVGARAKSGSKVDTEVRAVKVTFTDTFGWLPVKNNIGYQVNENMLVTSWKQGNHSMGSLLVSGQKSLHIPSSTNGKYGITAIGNPNGIKGLKLFKEDLTSQDYTLAEANSLTDSSKITEILQYKEGFLVSSSNSGLHYVNLAEKKAFKVKTVGSDTINDVYVEGNNVFVATNTGVKSGEIQLKSVPNTDKLGEVNFVSTHEMLNTSSEPKKHIGFEVGTIDVLVDKLILSAKTGDSKVVVVDKY